MVWCLAGAMGVAVLLGLSKGVRDVFAFRPVDSRLRQPWEHEPPPAKPEDS
jgi:hypothetical protein